MLTLEVRQQCELIANDNTCDRTTRSKAKGFADFTQTFLYVFFLEVGLKLFEVSDRLSKVLQNEAISAGEGRHAANAVISQLREWRTDAHFDEF